MRLSSVKRKQHSFQPMQKPTELNLAERKNLFAINKASSGLAGFQRLDGVLRTLSGLFKNSEYLQDSRFLREFSRKNFALSKQLKREGKLAASERIKAVALAQRIVSSEILKRSKPQETASKN